jgi:phosphoribosylaminoimidazole carboxylase (NCAIR synthetase)
MPFVIFAAPILSDNAFRMVEAAAALPDVQLAVITQDGEDRLLGLRGHVRHWQVADILDVEQLAWAAEGLARQFGPIHRLFGAFEQIQVQLAEVRARLGIEGMGVEAAHNFRDKARMKTLLRAAGLPCARHCLASTLDEAVAFAEANGFPVVVKPPAGAGAIATFRVDNMQSLIAALSRTPPTAEHPVLLEEFVQGEEHSFETMTVNGEHVWHSLTHYYPTPAHRPRESLDPVVAGAAARGGWYAVRRHPLRGAARPRRAGDAHRDLAHGVVPAEGWHHRDQ